MEYSGRMARNNWMGGRGANVVSYLSLNNKIEYISICQTLVHLTILEKDIS
jgi:hypothetical protein